jgi:tetratricopeptide (TPR) repeat protein
VIYLYMAYWCGMTGKISFKKLLESRIVYKSIACSVFVGIVILVSVLSFSCKTQDVAKSILDHPNLRRFGEHQINQIIIDAWGNFYIKKYEAAALDFERLIKKDYIDDDILFGAGISYYNHYEIIKAKFYIDEAIKHNPNHFEALYLRSFIYNRINNKKAGIIDLRQLLSIDYKKGLICGYYFNENDIADEHKLKIRKEQAERILTE